MKRILIFCICLGLILAFGCTNTAAPETAPASTAAPETIAAGGEAGGEAAAAAAPQQRRRGFYNGVCPTCGRPYGRTYPTKKGFLQLTAMVAFLIWTVAHTPQRRGFYNCIRQDCEA